MAKIVNGRYTVIVNRPLCKKIKKAIETGQLLREQRHYYKRV